MAEETSRGFSIIATAVQLGTEGLYTAHHEESETSDWRNVLFASISWELNESAIEDTEGYITVAKHFSPSLYNYNDTGWGVGSDQQPMLLALSPTKLEVVTDDKHNCTPLPWQQTASVG